MSVRRERNPGRDLTSSFFAGAAKRLALVALATSSPVIAQNQEASADTEWLWHERAIVEGILAGTHAPHKP